MNPSLTRLLSAGTAVLFLLGAPALALDKSSSPIGLYTAVQGTVAVQHTGASGAGHVALHDAVFFQDLIATEPASRTKALFQDDSVLTVGENSRVEVNEHIYDPSQNRRSTVINLMQGKLRALVGRTFAGQGSRFEVHAPTSVAAARGTYFTMWVEEKTGTQTSSSGVANIGDHGKVEFTSGGKSVLLKPGQFSVAESGKPPSAPALISPTAPVEVMSSILGTEVSDAVKTETPKQALQGIRGLTPAASSAPSSGATPSSTMQVGTSSSNVNKIVTEVTSPTQSATTQLSETLNSAVNRLIEQAVSLTDPVTSAQRSVMETTLETLGRTSGALSDLSVAPSDSLRTLESISISTLEPTLSVEPARTVEPVSAVEPVSIVEPVRTVEPVSTIEPVSVVEPVRTVEPISLTETVSVIEPVTAVEPVRALEPLAPAVEPIPTLTEPTKTIEPVVVDPLLRR